MKLAEAIKVLCTTYQSLDAVARGLEVNAKEVADAKIDPDTIEGVALSYLKKYNPYTAAKAEE